MSVFFSPRSSGPAMQEETHSSLLHRVRDVHDADGWTEFVRRYEPLLLAYVRGRGMQEHDARDVVQEIFTRLYAALPAFRLDRQRGRFRTWLYQVARNALTDWGRVHQRRLRAEQGWRQRRPAGEGMLPCADDSRKTEQRHVLARTLARVRAASHPRTWACFEQRILRRRPSAVIAAELGLTANAVNVNAARTLARLRKQCLACQKKADQPVALPSQS